MVQKARMHPATNPSWRNIADVGEIQSLTDRHFIAVISRYSDSCRSRKFDQIRNVRNDRIES